MTAVDVPTRDAPYPPAFRFVFHPTTWKLVVYPRGFGDDAAVLGLQEPWEGAVGDIFAIDAIDALVTFARVPLDRREIVETALEHWGSMDGWRLGFVIEDVPLADPAPPQKPPWTATCQSCLAKIASPKSPENIFGRWNWVSTRCSICRGRLAWSTASETLPKIMKAVFGCSPK